MHIVKVRIPKDAQIYSTTKQISKLSCVDYDVLSFECTEVTRATNYSNGLSIIDFTDANEHHRLIATEHYYEIDTDGELKYGNT